MDSSVTLRFLNLAASAATTSDSRKPANRASSLLTDEALFSQICLGSTEALAKLFDRYARLVRAVAGRILRDDAEADDLLQDVFLFIYRKAEVFDPSKSSARSWIVQMTYHRAIDRRRELQSRHFYSHVDLSKGVEVADHQSKTTEQGTSLNELVGYTTIEGLFEALTEDQRNTLCLHFYEGYTFGEIAEKLNQPLGNIRHHYYRGLEKLRQQIFKGKTPNRNGHGRK